MTPLAYLFGVWMQGNALVCIQEHCVCSFASCSVIFAWFERVLFCAFAFLLYIQAIYEYINSLNFSDCRARIRQIDAQEGLNDTYIIQVRALSWFAVSFSHYTSCVSCLTILVLVLVLSCVPLVLCCLLFDLPHVKVVGELSNAGQPMRPFVQTIVLAQSAQNKFFVCNDMFRYQDHILVPDVEPGKYFQVVILLLCMLRGIVSFLACFSCQEDSLYCVHVCVLSSQSSTFPVWQASLLPMARFLSFTPRLQKVMGIWSKPSHWWILYCIHVYFEIT